MSMEGTERNGKGKKSNAMEKLRKERKRRPDKDSRDGKKRRESDSRERRRGLKMDSPQRFTQRMVLLPGSQFWLCWLAR
jgi:hypothetical protein